MVWLESPGRGWCRKPDIFPAPRPDEKLVIQYPSLFLALPEIRYGVLPATRNDLGPVQQFFDYIVGKLVSGA
jgi:hypothetical protein